MRKTAALAIFLILAAWLGALQIGLRGERYAQDGIEYYQRGDYTRAIKQFEAAERSADGSVPAYHYWLGKLHIALSDTTNAGIWLRKYLDSADTEYRDDVRSYFRILERQDKIFRRVNLRPMPDYFNSGNSDYGAIPDPAGKYVYFTSLRPARKDKENIWRAEIFRFGYGKPQLVDQLSTDKNEAWGCFSPAQDSAWISGNFEPDKLDGDIYLVDTSSGWSKPRNVAALNSPQTEIQPMLFQNRYLFFSSSRNGGLGGLDIYVSELRDGVWSVPENLGPTINTAGNEQTPFLDYDGNTLYFASTGHAGFGGYDLYKAYKIGEGWQNWSVPENLGLPLNSPRNDRHFHHIPATNEGFISSDRKVSGFEKIYRFTFDYPPQPSYIVADENGNLISQSLAEALPTYESPEEPEPVIPVPEPEPEEISIPEPDFPLYAQGEMIAVPAPQTTSLRELELPPLYRPEPDPISIPDYIAPGNPAFDLLAGQEQMSLPAPGRMTLQDLQPYEVFRPEPVPEPIAVSEPEPEPTAVIVPEPLPELADIAIQDPELAFDRDFAAVSLPEPRHLALLDNPPQALYRPVLPIRVAPEIPAVIASEPEPLTLVQESPETDPRDIPQIEAPPDHDVRIQGTVTDQEGNPVLTNLEITGIVNGIRTRNIVITSSQGEFDTVARWSPTLDLVINEGGYLLYTNVLRLEPDTFSLDLIITLRKLEKKKALAFGSVFFANESAQLSQSEKASLDDVILTLLNNPGVRVKISGHAYDSGTPKFNLDLSDRRARAVVDYLISKGIDKKRLSWDSYGNNQPIYGAVDPTEQYKNRRVEIEVTK